MSTTSSSIICWMMCTFNFHCAGRHTKLRQTEARCIDSLLKLFPLIARRAWLTVSSCSLWLRLNPHTSSTVSTLPRESDISRSWNDCSLDNIPCFRSMNNRQCLVNMVLTSSDGRNKAVQNMTWHLLVWNRLWITGSSLWITGSRQVIHKCLKA